MSLFPGAAIISPCQMYRYRLDRATRGDGQRVMTFVMLNPSTADAATDDPTIRRCCGFATASNCGRLVVVNLFAFRATKPADLKRAADPIGPDNDEHILRAAAEATVLICAWGAHGGFRDRGRRVRWWLDEHRLPLFNLGLTREGHPRHPLFVRADQAPILWSDA